MFVCIFACLYVCVIWGQLKLEHIWRKVHQYKIQESLVFLYECCFQHSCTASFP